MLCAITLQDTVRIHPKDFGLPIREAVFLALTSSYGGRIIQGQGFCVLVDQVLNVSDQRLPHNDAGAYVDVVFTSLLFRPYPNEILTGTIVAQHPEDGLAISLGFFSNIIVHPSQLPADTAYNTEEGCFVWTANGQDYYFEIGACVKFRVLDCHFIDRSGEKPQMSKDTGRTMDVAKDWPRMVRERSTMFVQGSLRGPGLGDIRWWRPAEGDGEEGG